MSEENGNGKVKLATLAADLKNLKENFNIFKNNDFHELKEDVKSLLSKMNKPRLPMSVTWTLTVASGLIVGLVVLLLTT